MVSLSNFNREAYILSLNEAAKSFGSILENPEVYQTRIRQGIPELYTPSYDEPYLGPEKVPVIHPHIWAPEDLLTTCSILLILWILGFYIL